MNHIGMNRINLICLGVCDLVKSRAFYRDGLGFQTPNTEDNPKVVFFNNGGTQLELYERQSLARDIDENNPPPLAAGFGGITLAYNVKSKEEVDSFSHSLKVSAARSRSIRKRCFGAVTAGIFRILTDTIGWEVAYFDGWKFDTNDMLIIE